MKFLIIGMLLLSISPLCAQEMLQASMNLGNNNISSIEKVEVEAFAPARPLLNKQLWNRVTVNRFECPFLRLAVELKDMHYILMEMDGDKRIIIKNPHYDVITKAIMKLTLNSRPNLSGIKTQPNS